MLELIIPALNAEISDYFQQQFELAEQTTDGKGKLQPKIYCTKGQLDNIDLGNKNGVSYWRKTGAVNIDRDDDTSSISCIDDYTFTYPLVLIGAVPKKKLSKDDSYSEERMIITIIKQLTSVNLKTILKAKSADVNPGAYETDSVTILKQEYSSVDNINYDLAYFALNINVVVQIREDCIPEECE